MHAGTLDYLHAGTLWLLASMGAWEMGWTIDQMVEGKQVWPLIAWALIPGALLLVLTLRGERIAWPVRPRLANYLLSGAAPLAAFLWCWVLYANVYSDGDRLHCPMSLLNPLDIRESRRSCSSFSGCGRYSAWNSSSSAASVRG
jgi:hypothetical protein